MNQRCHYRVSCISEASMIFTPAVPGLRQVCQSRWQRMREGPSPPCPSHDEKSDWTAGPFTGAGPCDIAFLTHQIGQMNRCLCDTACCVSHPCWPVSTIMKPWKNICGPMIIKQSSMINSLAIQKMMQLWTQASQAGARYRPCFTSMWLADTWGHQLLWPMVDLPRRITHHSTHHHSLN